MNTSSNVLPVLNPSTNTLKGQLSALYYTLKGRQLNDTVVLDLSDCHFIHPIVLLTTCACIKEYSCELNHPAEATVVDYLQKVYFPNGISNAEDVDIYDYNAPIGYITLDNIKKREALENKFYQLIERWAGNVPGVSNALRYPLSELVDNIFEHSRKDYGWIFAQHYPKEEMLEICILDSGRGIAGSYQETNKVNVSSKDAIEMALQGQSTKILETGRGWGLYSSKEIVNKKLRGEFLLVTGNAALYSSHDQRISIDLPDFNWNGVIISYRIPYPKAPIDISDLLG